MREPDGEERYIFPGDVHGDTMSGEIGALNKEGSFGAAGRENGGSVEVGVCVCCSLPELGMTPGLLRRSVNIVKGCSREENILRNTHTFAEDLCHWYVMSIIQIVSQQFPE